MGPSGIVCWFMLKGMIIYKKGDNHMNNELGVVLELDFLFATCKLIEVEGVKVKDFIKSEPMMERYENHRRNEERLKKNNPCFK